MGGVEGLPRQEDTVSSTMSFERQDMMMSSTPFLSPSSESSTTKRPYSQVFILPREETDSDLLGSKRDSSSSILASNVNSFSGNETDSSTSSHKKKRKRKRKKKIRHHQETDIDKSMASEIVSTSSTHEERVSDLVSSAAPDEGLLHHHRHHHHHSHHHHINDTDSETTTHSGTKRGHKKRRKLSTTTVSTLFSYPELSSIPPSSTTTSSSISHHHPHHHLQTMQEEKEEYDEEQQQASSSLKQNDTQQESHLYSTRESFSSAGNILHEVLVTEESVSTTNSLTDSRRGTRKRKNNRGKDSLQRPFAAESSTETLHSHENPIFAENQFESEKDVVEQPPNKLNNHHKTNDDLQKRISDNFCKSGWILKAKGEIVKKNIKEHTRKLLISFKLRNYKVLHGNFNHHKVPSDIIIPFSDGSQIFLPEILSSLWASSVNASHFLELIPFAEESPEDRREQNRDFLDGLMFPEVVGEGYDMSSTASSIYSNSSSSHGLASKSNRRKKKRKDPSNKTTVSPDLPDEEEDVKEKKTIAGNMKRRSSWMPFVHSSVSLDSLLGSEHQRIKGGESNNDPSSNDDHDDDGARIRDLMIQEQEDMKIRQRMRSKRSNGEEWDSLLRVPSMNSPTYSDSPSFLLSSSSDSYSLSHSMPHPSDDDDHDHRAHESLDSPPSSSSSPALRLKYFIMGFTQEVPATKTVHDGDDDQETGKVEITSSDFLGSRRKKKKNRKQQQKSFVHIANLVIVWPTLKKESSLFR
jgi:hypothetical protein